MTRPEKAGCRMAQAIILMVDLWQHNANAERFYKGLDKEIKKEMGLRMMKNE